MSKHDATVLDVRNERANDSALHYPSRFFGVWYDTSETPLPYLLDRHTHARCTEALNAAHTWVLAGHCSLLSGAVGWLLIEATYYPAAMKVGSPGGPHDATPTPAL
jgi:hypothetical protein